MLGRSPQLFRDADLLQFVTDKENWNEELLLQFYATLHIRGYNRDPKTWVLEWMTGDVQNEAKAQDIIELTALLLRNTVISKKNPTHTQDHGDA